MGRSCAIPRLGSAIALQLVFLGEEKGAGLVSGVSGCCPAQVLALRTGKASGSAGKGRTDRALGLSCVGRALAAPLAMGWML